LISSLLSGRRAQLQLPEFMREAEEAVIGSAEGSASHIPAQLTVVDLDLMKELTRTGTTIAWVDDAASLAVSANLDDLRITLQTTSRVLREWSEWSDKHAAVFDPQEFQFIASEQPPPREPAGPGRSHCSVW
jgi:hypothetical protein